MNHRFKLATDWKPQALPDLINSIYDVVRLHFVDMRRALYGQGNYELEENFKRHYVTYNTWTGKPDDEKDKLYLRFLKDFNFDVKLIESTDGRLIIPNARRLAQVDTNEEQKTQVQTADITETVAKHYNQLQEAGLETRKESRIFFLRNFNNWIKSVLIGETINKIRESRSHDKLSVLDLCAGKGGDLLKWRKARISKLVCADIAETSVEQCEARYKEMVDRNARDRYPQPIFSSEFIAADCTKTRLKEKYKDPNTEFDVCSCQFSFHYCFESLPQAEMMLRNACECLKLGGYFIGTTPNSYEIVHRLRQSTDNSFGNEVYRITYEADDTENIPLYGAKYNFHLEGVVDCPEFLVYFPALEKMAEEFGMKLVLRKSFAEYFKEKSQQGDHSSLLRKMKALETYPAEEGTNLVSEKSDDYKAVEAQVKHLQESEEQADDRHRRPIQVGTLSQAEWEATTIYCVFVFRKVFDITTGEQLEEYKDSHKRHADNKEQTEDSANKLQKVS